MIEGWLAMAAEDFWKAVGGEIPFPRELERVIRRGIPLDIIALPQLSVLQIESWFQQQQVPFRFLCQNRSLCGCIVAARGHGLIFVDCDDQDDERHYTITHEIAHFLLDYLYPRQQALTLFGETISPVLDGERPPTKTERLNALLNSVRLGTYIDLMPRSTRGGLDQGYILRAEEKADRLALELLAPADQIVPRLVFKGTETLLERDRIATQILTSVYGLPFLVAKKYSAILLHHHSRESTAKWLGL